MKTLFFDLETSPRIAYIWRPSDQYVNHERLIEDSILLTWAAKWRDRKTVKSGRITPEEVLERDDSRIVEQVAKLVREADVVVAHNVDRFDLPRLNTRVLELGLAPLGPVRTIDTLKLVKKNFDLAYNKLDYVSERLGHGRKIETKFELWRRCMEGDEKALKEMVRYNRHDVVLLGEIFDDIIPHVRGLGRLIDGAGHLCPFCGSSDVVKWGFYRTNASTFQRWMCNGCSKYSRGRTAIKDQKLDLHPL